MSAQKGEGTRNRERRQEFMLEQRPHDLQDDALLFQIER